MWKFFQYKTAKLCIDTLANDATMCAEAGTTPCGPSSPRITFTLDSSWVLKGFAILLILTGFSVEAVWVPHREVMR